MLFNKYKNKIKELEKDLSFWQTTCKELEEKTNQLTINNNNLTNDNKKLKEKIIQINFLKQENEIMRQYYKLNEEPSSEVQAKVLINLKLHDLKFQMTQEKLDMINRQQLYFNYFTSGYFLSRYY